MKCEVPYNIPWHLKQPSKKRKSIGQINEIMISGVLPLKEMDINGRIWMKKELIKMKKNIIFVKK